MYMDCQCPGGDAFQQYSMTLTITIHHTIIAVVVLLLLVSMMVVVVVERFWCLHC